jgi:hypothetical protein
MFLAIVILIVSTAFFMFYLGTSCEKILRRRRNQQFFHSVVEAKQLCFPSVRKAVEDFGVSVDYPRFHMQLKIDFLTLSHLLKNAYDAKGFPKNERPYVRLLSMYFRAVFLALVIAHTLRLNERAALLKLTRMLEYFANVLGERLDTIRIIRFG